MNHPTAGPCGQPGCVVSIPFGVLIAHLTLIAVAACGSVVAQSPPGAMASDDATLGELSPVDGLLLLNNGRALEGRIAHGGDYYFVWSSTGQIRVPRSQVDMICQSLQDGYRRKAEQLNGGSFEERLKLARWCIAHELFSEASLQIQQAAQLDGQHEDLPRLKQQIRTLQEELPAMTSPIVATDGPTGQELDAFVRGLPRPLIAEFTTTIQPILLHTCATSSCHGPHSRNPYLLLRVPTGRRPWRRVTQRNLFSTLQQIDLVRPRSSPLLHRAVKPHGGQAQPSLDTNGKQFQALKVWATRCQGLTLGETASEIQPVSGQHLQGRSSQGPGGQTPPTLPGPGVLPTGSQEAALGRPYSGSSPIGRNRGGVIDNPGLNTGPESHKPAAEDKMDGGTHLRREGSADSTTSVRMNKGGASIRKGSHQPDPFDPEQFNRFFSPRPLPTPPKPAESTAASSADMKQGKASLKIRPLKIRSRKPASHSAVEQQWPHGP